MTNYKDWHYYKLKGRLDKAQSWKKDFLETPQTTRISVKISENLLFFSCFGSPEVNL